MRLEKRKGWYFICLLLYFVPFQNLIKKIFETTFLINLISFIDEIFILILILEFLITELILRKKICNKSLGIFFFILLFSIYSIFIGTLNLNFPWITFLGLFDYIKNIILIALVSNYSLNKNKYFSFLKRLEIISVIICVFGIFQEVSFFLGFPVERVGINFIELRWGILRVPSIFEHPNVFGLYSLLFFNLSFALKKRFCLNSLIFLSGILLSGSKICYTSLVLFLLYLCIFKRRKYNKWLLTSLLLIFLIMVLIIVFTSKIYDEFKYESYRKYTWIKSIEIAKERCFMGFGPGIYGGIISVLFKSQIYDKYNFDKYWYEFGIEGFNSLDAFWPQLIVEIGLPGVILFLYFFGWCFLILIKLKKEKKSKEIRNILDGYVGNSIALFTLSFGSGLNIAPFIINYAVLFGLILGIKDESIDNK